MATEFEKHVALEPDEAKQSQASEMYSQARDRAGEAARGAGENLGAISTTAVLFGIVGFALGWVCGQSSARSERNWR